MKGDRGRHRELDHAIPATSGRSGAAQTFEIFGESGMVRVARASLHRRHDRRLCDEARDIVHVTVRVVADDPTAEPEHLVDSEVLPHHELEVLS